MDSYLLSLKKPRIAWRYSVYVSYDHTKCNWTRNRTNSTISLPVEALRTSSWIRDFDNYDEENESIYSDASLPEGSIDNFDHHVNEVEEKAWSKWISALLANDRVELAQVVVDGSLLPDHKIPCKKASIWRISRSE